MSLLPVIIISNKWIIKACTIYITDQATHYIGEVFVQNFILVTLSNNSMWIRNSAIFSIWKALNCCWEPRRGGTFTNIFYATDSCMLNPHQPWSYPNSFSRRSNNPDFSLISQLEICLSQASDTKLIVSDGLQPTSIFHVLLLYTVDEFCHQCAILLFTTVPCLFFLISDNQ